MSKPVKRLLRREIARRLAGVRDLAVVSVVGIDGNASNRLRGELRQQGIEVVVVKNAMARQAFSDVGISDASVLLEGPCALAYGGESAVDVVREMFRRNKDVPALQVKGAYFEGEVFGPERVEELSRYPTRGEAVARIVSAVLGAGGRLAGALTGPGAALAGAVKTIEDKQQAEQ